MAKPVVLSDIGGAAEMVNDGIDGMLFQTGNLEELSDCLRRLSSRDDLRNSLGKNARKRVIADFKYSDMFQNYLRVLFK